MQSIVERLLDNPSLEQTALSNLVYINVHSIKDFPKNMRKHSLSNEDFPHVELL